MSSPSFAAEVHTDLPAWVSSALALPHLEPHFWTLIYSILAFSLVYIFSHVASTHLAPLTYPKLSPRGKHSWNVHAVSMAHAMVVAPLAAYHLLLLPSFGRRDKAFGWDDQMGTLHAIAVG